MFSLGMTGNLPRVDRKLGKYAGVPEKRLGALEVRQLPYRDIGMRESRDWYQAELGLHPIHERVFESLAGEVLLRYHREHEF